MNAADKKEVMNMLTGDILSRPIKKHADDCQCNGCLVAARKRELRAKNIKEGK